MRRAVLAFRHVCGAERVLRRPVVNRLVGPIVLRRDIPGTHRATRSLPRDAQILCCRKEILRSESAQREAAMTEQQPWRLQWRSQSSCSFPTVTPLSYIPNNRYWKIRKKKRKEKKRKEQKRKTVMIPSARSTTATTTSAAKQSGSVQSSVMYRRPTLHRHLCRILRRPRRWTGGLEDMEGTEGPRLCTWGTWRARRIRGMDPRR